MDANQRQKPDKRPMEERLEEMAAADWRAMQGMCVDHQAGQGEPAPMKSSNGKPPSMNGHRSTHGSHGPQANVPAAETQQPPQHVRPEDGTPQEPPALPTKEEFKDLVAKMKGGSKAALEEVRQLLNNHPEIWRHGGDLAKISELAQLKTVAGRDKLGVGLFVRYVNALKAEVAGSAPTPLERLAAERVVQCWLQVQHCDMSCSDINMPLPQLRLWGGGSAGRGPPQVHLGHEGLGDGPHVAPIDQAAAGRPDPPIAGAQRQ